MTFIVFSFVAYSVVVLLIVAFVHGASLVSNRQVQHLPSVDTWKQRQTIVNLDDLGLPTGKDGE